MKKLEKDVDRHKFGSTQMLERNEQLIKELENQRTQNSNLREQITKLETELHDAHVWKKKTFLCLQLKRKTFLLFRRLIIDSKNISNEMKMT